MPIRFAMDESADAEDYNVEEPPQHSLPESAEDLKVSAAQSVVNTRRRKRMMLYGGIAAFVLIVIISMSASIHKKRNVPESPRMQQTRTFLSLLTDTSALSSRKSPQYQAAQWLADTDVGTDIPSEPGKADSVLFLQRYALATLYFSTSGRNWVFDARFLNKDDSCEWLQRFTTKSGTFDMGVKCNNEGHVKEIRLRELYCGCFVIVMIVECFSHPFTTPTLYFIYIQPETISMDTCLPNLVFWRTCITFQSLETRFEELFQKSLLNSPIFVSFLSEVINWLVQFQTLWEIMSI